MKSVKDFKPIEFTKYENIDLDRLVMHAVELLDQNSFELSFENIVVASYKLFPKKFSLLGYKMYPDAKRVHDCAFRCTYKNRQWLGGKTRQGFVINEKSKKIFQEANDLLNGVVTKPKKASSQTRRFEYLLSEVPSSTAYQKYQSGKKSQINYSEFCFLLHGTIDSQEEVIKENYKILLNIAKELKRKEIATFLKYLEKKFFKD